jgi:hypothetical protein
MFWLVPLTAWKTHKVSLIFGDLILCLCFSAETEEYKIWGDNVDLGGMFLFTLGFYLSNELHPYEFMRDMAMDIVR